jgi:ATP-dependent DNA helicase RecQ
MPSPPAASGEALRAALRRHLGHSSFRPGQEDLVRAVLRGRDALGILPTGGGKSVCFQLPAFLLPGLVLVISPLISLMEDQVARARDAGMKAEVLNSALPEEDRRRVLARALAGEVKLLLVSPERLHVAAFRSALPQLPVSLLAVDEAHCISQWGHDFRPSYLRIGEARSWISSPVLALTATATPRVREEIATRLRLNNPFRVVGSFDRPNLAWDVEKVSGHGEKMRAIRALLRGREGATIVYASTRKAVEAVRRGLASRGLPALAYHAGLSPGYRTEVQDQFLHAAAPVVCATNAFGMGIDRPDVRMVVHYQLPGSLEAYYQEAGRAGRDGAPARCVALFDPRDRSIHDRFVSLSHPSEGELRRLHRHLRSRFPLHETVETLSSDLEQGLGPAFRERVLPGLRALARSGALSLEEMEPPAPGRARPRRRGDDSEARVPADANRQSGPQRLFLRLHTACPDLGALEALRAIAQGQVESVMAYAGGRKCRRRMLLGYFGEAVPEVRCHGCDRCRRALGHRVRWATRWLALSATALLARGGSD